MVKGVVKEVEGVKLVKGDMMCFAMGVARKFGQQGGL